eukprot:g1262.t1
MTLPPDFTIAVNNIVGRSDFLESAAATYAQYLSAKMSRAETSCGVTLPETAVEDMTASVVSESGASFLQTRVVSAVATRLTGAGGRTTQVEVVRIQISGTINVPINVPTSLYTSAEAAWDDDSVDSEIDMAEMFTDHLQASGDAFASVNVTDIIKIDDVLDDDDEDDTTTDAVENKLDSAVVDSRADAEGDSNTEGDTTLLQFEFERRK